MVSSQKRMLKIAQILIKYGFEEFVSGSKLEAQVTKLRGKSEIPSDLTKFERLRMALEELGTTYIKLGQILSQRTDLLPLELTLELEKLQDHIQPAEIDVKALITETFGHAPDHFFESLNYEPIGVASIGQVYEGRLKTGEHVALKIKKPGVEEMVSKDLAMIKELIGMVANHPKIKDFRPRNLFDSFKETLLNELDYLKEANNIRRFLNDYQEDQSVYVPEIYPQLCSNNIICMEFISGVKINDADKLKSFYPDISQLARPLCDYYFDQILEKGFYHADPHPGNVQVLKEGRICLLDYGMMGSLLEDDRVDIGIFFFRIVNKDIKGIVSFLEEINLAREIPDKDSLVYEIDELFRNVDASVESLDTAELLNKMLVLINKHKIVLPKYFFNLLRTITLLDGVLRFLSPEANIMEFIKPYSEKLMLQRANPKYLLKKMVSSAVGLEKNLMKLPAILNKLLSRAADDELSLDIKVRGLEESVAKLERISNRLILAILVGCLLVASSLVVLSKTPPFLWGMPLLGVIGYILSALLAFYIIIKMFRR
jgi:ubiquinone biosynthesis protein